MKKLHKNIVASCSGNHQCKTSFNKAWIQVRRRFKSCMRRVEDLRWWESLIGADISVTQLLKSLSHQAQQVRRILSNWIHYLTTGPVDPNWDTSSSTYWTCWLCGSESAAREHPLFTSNRSWNISTLISYKFGYPEFT